MDRGVGSGSFKHTRAILSDRRGVSLMLIVLFLAALGIGVVGVMTFGAKLRQVEKERITSMRLERVRQALQRYYLSHHDLPDPKATTPENTVPVEQLNLPQELRFDQNGQFIHYNCVKIESVLRRYPEYRDEPPVVDLSGLTLGVAKTPLAAVLVAPGPDKVIQSRDTETHYVDPKEGPGNDDLLVGITLKAEAVKIAAHAVAALQAAAKAYDAQFDAEFENSSDNRIRNRTGNNDGDLCYPRWYSYIDPHNPLDPTDDEIIYVTPAPYPYVDEGNYEGNYSGDCEGMRGGPPRPFSQRFAGNVRALGGNGIGCVRYGQLSNDPERGTASLDDDDGPDSCWANAAHDIAAVFGLNKRYVADPWNRLYQWGRADRWCSGYIMSGLECTDTPQRDAMRDLHYWAFFSMGPDPNGVSDDIVATSDRIGGYYIRRAPLIYQ